MESTEPIKVKSPITGTSNCFESTQPLGDGTITVNGEEPMVKSWMCLDSGYTSTSLNVEGSDNIKQYEETTAELIKDLRWVDPLTNLVWYPLVLNFPSFGIIFPDGTNKDNWQWMAAPAVDIAEEERQRYPIPGQPGQFYARKINMEAGKKFAPNQFYEAAKFLGFIQ